MTSLGLALLVIGAVVAVAEAHYPTHGIAGGAGVLIMAIGAALALTGLGAAVLVGLLAGGALAAVGAGGVLLSLKHGGAAVRGRRVRTGAEGIIGHIGTVRTWTDASGSVTVDGALWRARRSLGHSDDEEVVELHTGDPIVVEQLNGLTLCVRPAEEWELL